MKLSRKNKLLFLGIVLALIICYRFAIANTIAYYNEYESQKELINNNLNNSDLFQNLIQREKQLNKVLDQYNTVSGESFQNDLLKHITRLSEKHKLKTVDFKEPHSYAEENSNIKTYTFSLEGSFNGTLLLISNLENMPSLGFVKHIKFTKKRNYKNNTNYLVTEIMLQKTETAQNK